MRKEICSVLLCCIVVVSLFGGCGKNDNENSVAVDAGNAVEASEDNKESAPDKESTEEKKPVVTMRCAHIFAEDSPRGISYTSFEKAVEERTNGGIDVVVYHAAQLGTEGEITEMVKSGALESVRCGQFEMIAPKLLIYTMPFLFKDEEEFKEIAYGPIGEKLAEGSRENGLVVLATGSCGGFRQFTNNVRPITTPEDLSGIKMRVPPIASFVKTMEACGANVVSIPMIEVYMALKTGVADGQENPFVYIDQQKFYEVQEYLTVSNYSIPSQPFTVNADWFDGLSEEYQKILIEEAMNCEIYNDELEQEQNKDSYEMLGEHMEINVIDDAGRQAFIEASEAVYAYHIEQGYFTQEDLDEIKQALE